MQSISDHAEVAAVLQLHRQGEKHRPVSAFLCSRLNDRIKLNNRRQKEKRSLNRSGNVKYVK